MKKYMSAALSVIILFMSAACSFAGFVPKTVTVGDTLYRNGFYGGLYPINLTYESECYTIRRQEYRRVSCDKFDWLHSSAGDTTNGVLYCAESQWEQAKAYYEDDDHFSFYVQVNSQIIKVPPIDSEKFSALLEFAEENSYQPFGSSKGIQTRRLPMPDSEDAPPLNFYKESKDGYFTSYKGNTFHIVEGKLLLVFYYDYGHGEYEELVAVDVPDELGLYFIELVGDLELS